MAAISLRLLPHQREKEGMASPRVGRSPSIATLMVMASCGPLSLSLILPALPQMAAYFKTDYQVMQLTVSVYMAFVVLAQAVVGPISDRLGRRPTMLACLACFTVGTLCAVAAPRFEILMLGRMLQSTAVGGMVLAYAVVRDISSGSAEAASRIGYVAMGMGIAPLVAPMIGGVVQEIYGWKAIFGLMLCFGILATLIVFLDLNETNQFRSSSFRSQVQSYPEVIRSGVFWRYSAATALASGGFYAFLGGAPFVASEILNLSPANIGIGFGIISIGSMAGNFLSGHLSRRSGIDIMILMGSLCALSGGTLLVGLQAFGISSWLSLFGPMCILAMGFGLTMPNASAGIASINPRIAGSASGLAGTVQYSVGALLAFGVGSMLSHSSGASPLYLVMLATAVASCANALLILAATRRSFGGPI